MAGPFAAGDLFDAAFLASVARLHIVARRVERGGRFAEQRSKDLGSGIEFRDFRPYTPGDDFRSIDWNIYRRLGRVFLRLFEELEDLPLYLAVDTSASAFLETPSRARAGLRCALALAAISLNQHDSVGLAAFSDRLDVIERPRAGKGQVMRFAERLAALEPGGATDFRASFSRFHAMNLRPGLLVVVSDFFDPAGVEAVTDALGRSRHRLLLVQLTRPGDRDPRASQELTGDLRLRDCETGATEDVSVTPEVLARYTAAYDAFQEGLTSFAKRRHAGLVRLDVTEPVVPQLATLFESGSYAL